MEICARDCDGEKKMKQNYLNGSDFVMLIPRVKDAGENVCHMAFYTPDILLIIDYGLQNHGGKNIYYSVDNGYSNLSCLNQSHQARCGPIL